MPDSREARTCVTCKWWGKLVANTVDSVFSGSFECLNQELRATGIHPETGWPVGLCTLPHFGCVQHERLDRVDQTGEVKMERKYSVQEIDRMRSAIRRQFPMVWTGCASGAAREIQVSGGGGGGSGGGDITMRLSTAYDAQVEDRLLTYMINGTEPDELDPPELTPATSGARRVGWLTLRNQMANYLYAYVMCGRKAWHLEKLFSEWEEVEFSRGDYTEHHTFRLLESKATDNDRQLARDYGTPFEHGAT